MKLKNALTLSLLSVRALIVVVCVGLVFVRYAMGTKFASDLPPLIFSTMNLEQDKVKKMLDQGQFVDVVDERSFTSLHHAVEGCDDATSINLVKLLLFYFAGSQERNKRGQTPIHLTREIDNINVRMEVMGWLIKNGAQVSEQDNRGHTLLDDLAEFNMAGDIETTLSWWGDLFTLADIEKAKGTAAYFGYDLAVAALEKFYAKRTKITLPRDLNELMIAILVNNLQAVGQLAGKASLKEGSEKTFGYRPLHIAVSANKLEAADILLGNGADSNAPDSSGNPPLFMVERLQDNTKKRQFIQLFIQRGVNINARNNSGDTLLHLAVKKRDINTVEFLVGVEGIVTTTKNSQGRTARMLAKDLGYADIQSLLK